MITIEPHRNTNLIGHDEALEEFRSAFQSNRMPQAWLLVGQEGIGKATLAFHVANYVLSNGRAVIGNLNPEDPTMRLVAAEAHPDLFVLQKPVDEKTGEPKKEIPAENARKISPFLHQTATQGLWRVAIIDQAQALNRYGQNAILKIIEEPPAHCIVLLTTTTVGMLLPTIRSRCRLQSLRALSDGAMRSVLGRLGATDGLDNNEVAMLLSLARGSVGFALKMLRTETIPLYAEMKEILEGLPSLDIMRVHALGDKVARKENAEVFEVLSTLLVRELQERLSQKARAGADARLLAQGGDILEKTARAFETAVIGNLNRKLTLVNVFLELQQELKV